MKTVQSNTVPVKSAPAAPVPLKNAVKQTALAASQAKPASTTVPGAAQPDDTSESSSSDSEDEERPLVTQVRVSEILFLLACLSGLGTAVKRKFCKCK